MKKLAIISTHPIQYNAPFFRLLAQSNQVQLKVFYTWGQSASGTVYDPTFQQKVQWDIPLLEGYEFQFVENQSTAPGSHHFKGIVNKSLIALIKDWRPHYILVYGWSFQSHLQVMRYFKGKIPVFFRGDSNLLDEKQGFQLKKIMRRIFLSWVYRFVDKAFVVGKANKTYYLAHGLKAQQLIDAPHTIDIARFQDQQEFAEQQANKWKASLGIEKEAPVFLFAGKFEPKKSPELLIKAFLALDHKEAHLIMIGNGVMESDLKKIAHAYPQIHFLPFQNQSMMPVVYRLGNVFVLPSAGPGETWGLAVNEAMACGRPVIVSSGCGCEQDLVKEGITGWHFSKNEPSELTAKLQLALETGLPMLQKIGAFNAEFIQSHSMQHYVNAIEAAIF